MNTCFSTFLGIATALAPMAALAQTNDKTQANSYDDAWKTAWVTHCRSVYTTSGKTAGFVLEIGDSITYANPYSQWPRQAVSSATSDSPDDGMIFAWANTSAWDTGSNNDTGVKNGWYLAAADTFPGSSTLPGRGMTAAAGIEAVEYVSGDGNGGTAMPTETVQANALADVANGTTYTNNLQINTVALAFQDAQAAVVMLGTNDARNADGPSTYLTALETIVGVLESANIVVVLSTVPPSTQFDVTGYNDQIRSYAQSHGLPLIDFYAEILARQPTAWSSTLISSDGIHPSASGTGAGGTAYTSSSDPYANGGNPATNATGEACTQVGYLLRSWLTIQKLKEVNAYVVNGQTPPSPSSPPPPSPSPSPSGGVGGGSGNKSSGLKCGATGLEAALVVLLAALARRRAR